MSLQDTLERLELAGAWSEREAFYVELAQSLREKELLLDFANAELKIANSKRMRNPARASLMEAIRRDRKSTRLNSSHRRLSRMPSSA